MTQGANGRPELLLCLYTFAENSSNLRALKLERRRARKFLGLYASEASNAGCDIRIQLLSERLV